MAKKKPEQTEEEVYQEELERLNTLASSNKTPIKVTSGKQPELNPDGSIKQRQKSNGKLESKLGK